MFIQILHWIPWPVGLLILLVMLGYAITAAWLATSTAREARRARKAKLKREHREAVNRAIEAIPDAVDDDP